MLTYYYFFRCNSIVSLLLGRYVISVKEETEFSFIDRSRFLLFLLHEMESDSKYPASPGAIVPLINSSTFLLWKSRTGFDITLCGHI